MLRILRQLNVEEAREVIHHAQARPGAGPEEIIRCLSRLTGAGLLGLFTSASDEALLDHVGRRLGMQPHSGGPRALLLRERAVLACYLRQAWEAADPARRWTLLNMAVCAWDDPVLPRPEPPADMYDEAELRGHLEGMLQHAAGCRALAVALEAAPMELPSAGPLIGALRLPFGLYGTGHGPVYAVLLVLWRARTRLLRERRLQRVQIERQIRQLESLITIRRRNLSEAPAHWALNPLGGLSLTAAAGTSLALHAAVAALQPVTMIPAVAVGLAGLAWSASASICRPNASSDQRVAQMESQLDNLRVQQSQLERELLDLEAE